MQPIDTRIKQLDVLPLLKYYMDQLNLYELFDKYVPNASGCELEPAQVLCLMVLNLVVNAAKPLYRVEEWLESTLDGVSERPIAANKYNDDRLGRTLDKLNDPRQSRGLFLGAPQGANMSLSRLKAAIYPTSFICS